MVFLAASCLAALITLAAAQSPGQVTPQGLTAGVNSELDFLTVGNLTASDNNNLFIQNVAPDLCNIGPSVWCQSPQNANVCGVASDVVGVCGFSTTNCPLQTISQFCASNPTATSYVGGLSGSRAGFYGYAVLAVFWAPSSCPATGGGGNGVSQNGFCTSFTGVGSHAATNLVLHGMWPDYGALYASDPQPPAYAGAYQGFPQYCYSPAFNGTACWVGGGLCTSNPNATLPSFSQTSYETCMRQQKTTQCLVPQATVNALGPLFATYAPGYIDQNTTFGTGFLDHEFNKHASCYGNYFTRNSTAFFQTAIGYVEEITAPGQSGAAIASYAGGNISYAAITALLNGTASPQCNSACQLSEVWYCLGREAAGFTTNIVKCTTGNLASQTCSQCTGGIQIPLYPGTPKPTTAPTPSPTTQATPNPTTTAAPAPTPDPKSALHGAIGSIGQNITNVLGGALQGSG